MKDKITLIARILLGSILIVFGLNGFFHFMPNPEVPGEAGKFLGALFESGYIFPVISAVELVAGIALLANRFVAVALIIFAPIAVNIILFHLFLDLRGIGPGLVVFVLNLFLLFANKEKYAGMLSAR